MTETRILELLHKLNRKEEEIPTNAKYMPEYVDIFAKSIANIFYKTIKYKSYAVTSKRLEIIVSIYLKHVFKVLVLLLQYTSQRAMLWYVQQVLTWYN